MDRLNLPLPDRAGRGVLEQRISSIVSEMTRCGYGVDTPEFVRLSHQLDLARAQFHRMYNVREHPVEAPIRHG